MWSLTGCWHGIYQASGQEVTNCFDLNCSLPSFCFWVVCFFLYICRHSWSVLDIRWIFCMHVTCLWTLFKASALAGFSRRQVLRWSWECAKGLLGTTVWERKSWEMWTGGRVIERRRPQSLCIFDSLVAQQETLEPRWLLKELLWAEMGRLHHGIT